MKALIVSDIHGSLPAAQRTTELAEGADLVLCLGDVLYHGPRNDLPEGYNPKAVITLMNSLADRIVAVRGNCEAEVDQMVLTFPVMGTTAEVYMDGYRMTLSHGHIYNEENLPPGAGIFLYGHTHIPVCHLRNGVLCFNPGSASIPKGGWEASFGYYEDGILELRRLRDGEVLMRHSLRNQE